MVDTLSSNHSQINSLKNQRYICLTEKSITEPDNGHKTSEISKLDFTLESERLKTFSSNWRSSAVRVEDLAKAGFYFLNNPRRPDLVKCAFCKAEICNWEEGDVPLDEHMRWSPNCPFIKSLGRNNRNLAFIGNPEGQDVCGNAEMFSNSVPETETFRLIQNMVNNFDDEKIRLESFSKWPKSSKLKPEDLAAAGFYYTGTLDHVVCFDCGQALKDWKDDDVPWEQHALWFPHCTFVLSRKGESYVQEVKAKFGSLVPCNNVTKEKESECEPGSSAPSDDVLLCKICGEHERNVIFMPCNHILACMKCKTRFNTCPVCRKPIQETHKVFLS